MQEPGIIRHRGKLDACVSNAQAFLVLADKTDAADFFWMFTEGEAVQNCWERMADIPSSTRESIAMANSLKRAGFKFVGPTICYAFMQSAGMVNDHLVGCFRHESCSSSDTKRQLIE